MRVPRLRRVHLFFAAALCGVLLVRNYTNFFDIVLYVLWKDAYTFPLSLHCNRGRLGNQICTYATLYGLSRLNRRRLVLQHCNKKHLSHVFKGPSQAPSIFEHLYFRWNTYEIWPWFKPTDAVVPRSSNFMGGYYYPCSYTFFHHVREDLRRELTFHDHLINHAQDVLRTANVHGSPDVTYVGVHVRRGDYQKRWLEAFEGVPVNAEYFRRAVTYFRDKYRNVVFVAISDDRLWCVEHLAAEFGMHVPKEAPGPEFDMAVIAACNHTILSYGTFGFWGAYLAGGEVLYFDKFLRPNTTFSRERFVFNKMYPPDWKGIVTVNTTIWPPPGSNPTSVYRNVIGTTSKPTNISLASAGGSSSPS